MGRTIADENGGGGDFNPTAMIREEGAMLRGTLVSKRDVKTQYGMKPIFVFTVLDASCKFMANKAEVEPSEGDMVDVFAPTRLARQLAHVNVGETVMINYKGTKKVGRGNPAHIFGVVVE